MTLKTKQELTQWAIDNFADNTTGGISESDLRDWALSFIDSNQSYKVQVISAVNATISEVIDLIFLANGATEPSLPAVSGYKDRSIQVVNDSGADVTVKALGSDTIEGAASMVLQNQSAVTLWPDSANNKWRRISQLVVNFDQLLDTPNGYTGSAGSSVAVNTAESGLIFKTKSNGYGFQEDNIIPTLISAVGSFVDIDCDLVGQGSEFNVFENSFMYTGAATKTFLVEAVVSSRSVIDNDKICIGIFKNDITRLSGKGCAQVRSGASKEPLIQTTTKSLATLANGDVINFKVANLSTDENITCEQIMVTVAEF